jgi:putative membrane protein
MKKPVVAAVTALLLATTVAACGRTEMSAPATATDAVVSTNLPPVETSSDVMQVISGDTVFVKEFAEMAGRSNNYEIAAATIAEQKAQDPALKAYARHMIEDHGAMAIEMNNKAVLAGPQFTIPVTLDSKHQAMIDQLNAASGSQFDMLYVSQMRQSHKDTYELLNAFSDRGNESNFQEFAQDNKQAVYDHLVEIDKIASGMMSAHGNMSGTSSM